MAAESVFGTDHEGPFCSEGGWRGIPQGLKPLTLLVEVAEAQGDPMLKHGATSLGLPRSGSDDDSVELGLNAKGRTKRRGLFVYLSTC
jgi:hypothetical protein